MENDGYENVANDTENPYIPLATSIQTKLQRLSPLSSNRCIYRVPDRLRNMNSKVYTPKVVSIGPLHHGNKSLKLMEDSYKLISNTPTKAWSFTPSIIKLLLQVFHKKQALMDENLDRLCSSKKQHFVDLLRELYVPLKPKEGELKSITTPSITKLHQAGVKLKVGSSKNLFDIVFSNGILEIPELILSSDAAEVALKNLLAFEQ
ncbi:hypothetical protein L484_000152 [Morus notabilis]|uniref:Uncharacterized protein n=1 Tax=Morus notabilis TaxID=981085 RepID=W9SFR1_9ROSA|nr:hypothetical protein L484_000152 [Morus notabilis]